MNVIYINEQIHEILDYLIMHIQLHSGVRVLNSSLA